MKLVRIVAAASAALLTWGCFLSPGKFDAALDVRRDGSFRYSYTGEMILAVPGGGDEQAAETPFDADGQICSDEASGSSGEASAESDPMASEARDCTAAEIAQKRKEWEEGRAGRLAEKQRNDEMARRMFGGIDPSDQKTMAEFARRLQGHSGFKRVQHKGNGVFDVAFELSGRLDHDFVFPVFPEVDFVLPFVKVHRVAGNRVRIVAPAFGQPQDGFKAMGGMFQGDKSSAPLPKPEGNFTLTTDAEVVTNNTQDGPVRAANGRTMRWTISPLDTERPEALLQL